jgi:hypothetical protein
MPAQTLQQPIPHHPHRQQQHAQQPPAIFAYSHPDSNPYHQQQTPSSYFSFSPPLTASSSSSSGTSPSLSELAQLAGLDLDAPFHPLPVPALSIPRTYHPTIVNNTSSNVSSRPLSPASVLRRQARLDSFSDSLSGPSSSSSSYIPPFSPPYHHHIAPTSTSLPSRISSWIPSFLPPSSTLDRSTPQYRSSQQPPGSSSSSGGEKKRRSSTSNLLVSSGLGLGQKLASQLASSTSSSSSAAAAAKIGKHVCPSEGCSYSFVSITLPFASSRFSPSSFLSVKTALLTLHPQRLLPHPLPYSSYPSLSSSLSLLSLPLPRLLSSKPSSSSSPLRKHRAEKTPSSATLNPISPLTLRARSPARTSPSVARRLLVGCRWRSTSGRGDVVDWEGGGRGKGREMEGGDVWEMMGEAAQVEWHRRGWPQRREMVGESFTTDGGPAGEAGERKVVLALDRTPVVIQNSLDPHPVIEKANSSVSITLSPISLSLAQAAKSRSRYA